MNFELKQFGITGAAALPGDVLVVLVPKSFKASGGVVSDLVAAAVKAGDFEAKSGKTLQMYRPAGIQATRLLLVGCEDGTPRHARQAVAGAAGALKSPGIRHVALCFAWAAGAEVVHAAVVALADATYVYTTTKSKPEGRMVERVEVGVADVATAKPAFDHALAVIQGVELAKEWGNRPANHATPTQLAKAASGLAKRPRVRCEVLGPREVAKLGMGAFLAVARGSEEELRFVVLRYDGGPKAQAPTVLVGKGITFDTGGISIKPAPEMDEMKFDMCGAASVLGVFRALAELRPAINVVGLIPTCENMPDGRAVKPGDVVTSMSGQTIEILNTDAEGRLLLCDTLTYAKRFDPDIVIDVATLTGACVVALGRHPSGLMSNNEALAADITRAANTAWDRVWPLPLWDDYQEQLKSNFADLANIGGPDGGSITAGCFLSRFAKDFAWAHIDIAGTAWKTGKDKGATGRPVPLLVQYLYDRSSNP